MEWISLDLRIYKFHNPVFLIILNENIHGFFIGKSPFSNEPKIGNTLLIQYGF